MDGDVPPITFKVNSSVKTGLEFGNKSLKLTNSPALIFSSTAFGIGGSTEETDELPMDVCCLRCNSHEKKLDSPPVLCTVRGRAPPNATDVGLDVVVTTTLSPGLFIEPRPLFNERAPLSACPNRLRTS